MKTIDEIIDELSETVASLRDTFRHNKVIPSLQEWREGQIENMEECIEQLKATFAENTQDRNTA